MNKFVLINNYFKIWAIFLPISSFLLIPSVQGTTPGYVMALFSLIFIPAITLLENNGDRFIRDFIIFIIIYLLLNSISQLCLASTSFVPDWREVILINTDDKTTILFRKSMFTQSIYLCAGILTFLYIKYFYNYKWDKFIFWGAILLGLYGIYEVLFFVFFHANGDFISNRTFANGSVSGSLFQTYTINSFTMERLKSLTGEPSMYALTILPYWIYSVHTKHGKTSLFLFLTLLLSTSTTAFLGITTYIIMRLVYLRVKNISLKKCILVIILIIIALIIIAINYNILVSIFDKFIVQKINMQNQSGIERFNSFKMHMKFYLGLPILNKMFGVGFGYVRSTDLFSTLLVNNGFIGFFIFTALFLFPVFKLKRNDRNIGIKSLLVVTYVSLMVSVPEFSYLSTWLFLGIAYKELLQEKNNIMNKKQIKVGI